MSSVCFKNIVSIIYTNGVTMFTFIQKELSSSHINVVVMLILLLKVF